MKRYLDEQVNILSGFMELAWEIVRLVGYVVRAWVTFSVVVTLLWLPVALCIHPEMTVRAAVKHSWALASDCSMALAYLAIALLGRAGEVTREDLDKDKRLDETADDTKGGAP